MFDKVSNNKTGSIFSFLNEINDPKYLFFQDKIIVKNEKPIIDFLKMFLRCYSNNQDEEFIEVISKKLLDMILSLLVDYFKKNTKIFWKSPNIRKINF